MKTRGFVLKRIEYLETSFILTLVTNEGYKSLIVKGAKRKNSMKLSISEPLTLIDYVSSDSKLPSLIEGVVINNYDYIKEDILKYSIASILSEYMYLDRENKEFNPKVYDLFINTLDKLKDSKDLERELFKFEINFLIHMGSSLKEEHIKEYYPLYDSAIEDIVNIMNDKPIINRNVLREFFIDYFNQELGLKLKSKRIYKEIIKEI